jgi:hypothetical protein
MGWFEVQMPFRYVYPAGALALACIVLAVVRIRRPSGARIGVLLLLFPTVASYAILVQQVLSWYVSTHYYRGLSGRYLFVGMVGFIAVVGIGITRIPALRRWAPLLILAGGALLQLKAVSLAVLVWWRPHGGTLRQAWHALLAWSPWSPLIVKTVLVLFLVAAVLAMIDLVRIALRPDVDDEPVEPDDVGLVAPRRVDVRQAAGRA